MTASKAFVITGAESSGKTTLATQLCDSLQAPLVPEISREYLSHKLAKDKAFEYQQQDLLNIAKQQYAQEVALLNSQPECIICDTDLLVIMIWSEVKYGSCPSWITEEFEKAITRSTERHYLLCDWKIPWQADSLRENPHDRQALFERYLQKLKAYKLDYSLIKGNPQQRLQQALRLARSC